MLRVDVARPCSLGSPGSKTLDYRFRALLSSARCLDGALRSAPLPLLLLAARVSDFSAARRFTQSQVFFSFLACAFFEQINAVPSPP